MLKGKSSALLRGEFLTNITSPLMHVAVAEWPREGVGVADLQLLYSLEAGSFLHPSLPLCTPNTPF